MAFTDEQIERLRAPLDKQRIKREKQGSRMVSYIEGWDAIATANDIFGFDGWEYAVLGIRNVGGWENRKGETVCLYEATVEVIVGGVRRVDIGTNITSGDTAEAHETGVKGAVTDGLKRALRTFGNQFGNSLYDKDAEKPRAEAPAMPDAAPPRPRAGNAPGWANAMDEAMRRDGVSRERLAQHLGVQTATIRVINEWLDRNPALDVRDLVRAAATDPSLEPLPSFPNTDPEEVLP